MFLSLLSFHDKGQVYIAGVYGFVSFSCAHFFLHASNVGDNFISAGGLY